MKRLLLLTLCFSSYILSAQTPCENGKAGDYDCLGIDLQGHINALDLGAEELDGNFLNDIWGWVDPDTGKEYAIVGMTNGTSFVDVSDPVNPVVLGVLPEHNSINPNGRVFHDGAKSIWRDIKVFQNHAYIVSEDPDHGVQVFDLTGLRNVANPSVTNLFDESGHYDGLGQAHNIAINEESGFLYAVGFRQNGNFSCNGGGLHIVDLSDPKNPVFAGCFDEDGYTHDAQCVIYQGSDPDYIGKEICFNSNEDEVVIVDVSNKSAIQLISKRSYSGVAYTHQGWLTEDHRYFISNDEVDELNFGHNTRSYIWDVEDLDAPVLLGYFEHDRASIDHNLYTKDQYIYESNYTSGLVILDTAGISQGSLKKVAYFDTYVSSDVADFFGSWSNYPYLPSGNIIISDITNGLFIVKVQSIFINEQPEDVTACVGEHINIPIDVQGGDVNYQWQIDEGNGFEDISNFERYINSKTSILHAHTLELSQNGNQFRCIVDNGITEIISDTMTVFVIDSPRAEFNFQTLDEIGNVSFDNTSINADFYLWDFGDGNTSVITSPTHQYSEDGIYTIELVAVNDCTSDTLTSVLEIMVLSAEDVPLDLAIYPNVVEDRLLIRNHSSQIFSYKLYSLDGILVLSGESLEEEKQIGVGHLNKGLYVVQMQIGNQTVTEKVVIK